MAGSIGPGLGAVLSENKHWEQWLMKYVDQESSGGWQTLMNLNNVVFLRQSQCSLEENKTSNIEKLVLNV